MIQITCSAKDTTIPEVAADRQAHELSRRSTKILLPELHLREIQKKDGRILLDWRNDITTRNNFLNNNFISEVEHTKYINETINHPKRSQFILEYNQIPVGTIRGTTLSDNRIELYYHVSPLFRGKKIGQQMMELYLSERQGNFLCKVKNQNIPSIKMIEKFGFKLFKTDAEINFYGLAKIS